MGYKILYIWVEGKKDFRFFDSIIKPIFENKYSYVQIIKYGEMKKEKVNDYLESIISMGADYIFVGDINTYQNKEEKKRELMHKYKKIEENRIIVVKKEIESWYLAGLDAGDSRKLGVTHLDNTDDVIKEQFNSMKPRRFDSEIDFMIEILKHYSVKTAQKKNESFRDFVEEYDC